MAVGIAGDDGAGYRGTGYLFIESTQISLVGSASEYLSGGVAVLSEPLVIRVGSGDHPYRAWSDVAAILDALGAADRKARILASEKAEAEAAMKRLIPSGRTQEYAVRADECRHIAAEYDAASTIADRIRHHLDDRAGLSRWLGESADAGQGAPRESGADSSALSGSAIRSPRG
jgi:hypothetical protein